MICTSSHNDWQSDKYRTNSISGNRGKDANYQGKCYPELAPKLSFWKIWHDNIGKIDEKVLLCYENNNEFCHRHIVAKWLEITLGIYVPEIKLINNEIKEVYSSESVYLCTMCDGPMNHFHVQLIPRYDFEKRGSKNIVKERQ